MNTKIVIAVLVGVLAVAGIFFATTAVKANSFEQNTAVPAASAAENTAAIGAASCGCGCGGSCGGQCGINSCSCSKTG